MNTLKQSLGLIGLGVMGQNLALNFASHGFSVCGFDLDPGKRAQFTQRTQGLQAQCAEDLTTLVANLQVPRRVMLMVPAGQAVDEVLQQLRPLLSKGDVIIDGGNSLHSDTARRLSALQGNGILYVGTGVSGGEEGALRGPALMPGGATEAWPLVAPMLQAIAAQADDGQPCCDWMGGGGSGHFVKMVHNGIEYADMQMIGEAYWLMSQLLGLTPQHMSDIFRQWNQGELSSYLIGITADILATQDPESDAALVDMILDTAEQKGTGKWTSQVALDLGVAAPPIADAVSARTISAVKNERVAASRVLFGPKPQFAGSIENWLPKIHNALVAAKICAYAQGFALLRAADDEYRWNLSHERIAKVWRAGCIIRAKMLDEMRRAFEKDSQLSNLLVDGQFSQWMNDTQQNLREVVAQAALHGVPAPAFMSALSYYDAYRSARLPANLLQAQRDYFGAHTYQRIDREGKFHTRWSS